jgi:hypothetical protein
MIKLFLLMTFLFMCNYSLKADETPGNDQEFMSELDNIKNPFEDGYPKPVVVKEVPVYHPVEVPKPPPMPKPMPRPIPVIILPPPVELPSLNLQGVMVGDEMHEAIINDQAVPLNGIIDGVRIESVTKQGVGLSYRCKKFFLKVD